MHLLYPSNPFNKREPDEDYSEEYHLAVAFGLTCSLFSFEDFQAGFFKATPPLPEDAVVVYRGWMLSPTMYTELYSAIIAAGAQPLTAPQHYKHCHWLPEWYPKVATYTIATRFFPADVTVEELKVGMANVRWGGYFVKDFVKSLGAKESVVTSIEEIPRVARDLKHFRGEIEGGLAVRALVRLKQERRYFVICGQPISPMGPVSKIVEHLAPLIDSPFFSVDVAKWENPDGYTNDSVVVELGDGQVSSCKEWPIETFVKLLVGLSHVIKTGKLKSLYSSTAAS